ncbi:aminotransferase class V-fold PLP-dependent enzyme, partial [Pseudomonas aeruginosa]
LLPWPPLALPRDLLLRVLSLDERGVVDLGHSRKIIGERPRLLAISKLANVRGSSQPQVELMPLAR